MLHSIFWAYISASVPQFCAISIPQQCSLFTVFDFSHYNWMVKGSSMLVFESIEPLHISRSGSWISIAVMEWPLISVFIGWLIYILLQSVASFLSPFQLLTAAAVLSMLLWCTYMQFVGVWFSSIIAGSCLVLSYHMTNSFLSSLCILVNYRRFCPEFFLVVILAIIYLVWMVKFTLHWWESKNLKTGL